MSYNSTEKNPSSSEKIDAEALTSIEQKINFISDYAIFITNMDTVLKNDTSNKKDQDTKKYVKNLLMKTQISDISSRKKPSDWHDLKSTRCQKLASYQNKCIVNEPNSHEKPSERQENIVFKKVSLDNDGLEINKLDELDIYLQKRSSQAKSKFNIDPRSLSQKKSSISKYCANQRALVRNRTKDCKTNRILLRNLDNDNIEIISSDDEKANKKLKKNGSLTYTNPLTKESEKKNYFVDFNGSNDTVYLPNIYQDEFFINACKKISNTLEQELQHNIKDVQLSRELRHHKDEEFEAITNIIGDKFQKENLNPPTKNDI